MFDVNTRNGSRVAPSTAGIESVANTMSLSSIAKSARNSGVTLQPPFVRQKYAPSECRRDRYHASHERRDGGGASRSGISSKQETHGSDDEERTEHGADPTQVFDERNTGEDRHGSHRDRSEDAQGQHVPLVLDRHGKAREDGREDDHVKVIEPL